jgi:hypothetical protein
MYNHELIERFFKHKRRFKSLRRTIKSLLNQSRNNYNQDTIYIKVVKSQTLYKESVSYIFFTYPLHIQEILKR